MASGKTSIGRLVAERLGVPFVDTDACIVAEHGSINDFFARNGETAFREVEEVVVARELARPDQAVVSLGGGAITSASTRQLLSAHTVILLMTTEEAVLARANREKRPLLKEDPTAWGRLLRERKHLYEKVADVTFDTSRVPKDRTAQNIIDWLRAEESE